MPVVIRDIKDEQCAQFQSDMADLRMAIQQVLDRHKSLSEDIWLGGPPDANNTEKAPWRTTKAMKLLIQAAALVDIADHDVVMFRMVGDSVKGILEM